VRSVTTAEVADFLRNLRSIKRGKKGKREPRQIAMRSRNNARQTLGAFFKYCRERGWLPKDHDGIAQVPQFKEKPNEIEIFTPQEMTHFLTYARPEMVPFLALGAFAGLRSAEIERLDWAEVHLAEQFIEVKAAKSKTGSRRLAPLSENLAKWLAAAAQKEGRVVPFDNINKPNWLAGEGHERGIERGGEEREERSAES